MRARIRGRTCGPPRVKGSNYAGRKGVNRNKTASRCVIIRHSPLSLMGAIVAAWDCGRKAPNGAHRLGRGGQIIVSVCYGAVYR